MFTLAGVRYPSYATVGPTKVRALTSILRAAKEEPAARKGLGSQAEKAPGRRPYCDGDGRRRWDTLKLCHHNIGHSFRVGLGGRRGQDSQTLSDVIFFPSSSTV